MHLRRPALTAAVSLCLALASGFASAPAAPVARAAADGGSARLLDRYLRATGGRTVWEKDVTLHGRLSLTAFGFKGTSEQWAARPDRVAAVTKIGPFTIRQGTIGARAWRVDQNGKLQWLDGRELEDARGSAYFDQEMWLAPDLGGGRAAVVGSTTEGGTTFDMVEITPPVGKPRRLYFDRATGLLSKMIQPADAQTIEVSFSGYETLAGRLRARDSLQRVPGAPANDVRAHLDSLAVGEPADSALFLPPAAPVRDFRFLDGASAATIPMRYSARHVWVKVAVNGGPAEDFLLDTGASVTVLDSACAARIGLASQGRLSAAGAGASGTMSFTRLESLRVVGENGGGVEVAGQNVLVAGLNRTLAPAFWREVGGVLGYDFISRFVVTVDFDNQTLVLQDPERFTYGGKGTALPITFSGGVPVVRGVIDSLYEGEFRLDVGSGSSVDLHTPFVAEHGLEAKAARTVPDPAGGFGGTFERLATRMRSFTVGPFVVSEPLVELSRASAGAMASRDYAGNVGNRVLERFTCTFDYARKTLYLEPGRRFTERQEFTRFGAQLFKSGERVVVGFVVPGSAAAAAGLAEDDDVVAIAGKPASSYTPDSLWELFDNQPEGTRVAIELARQGQARKVQVKLKSLL